MKRFCGRYSILIPGTILGTFVFILAQNAVGQTGPARKMNPQTQLLNNYRKYPDRYIRILNETWKYDEVKRTAIHSFTLKNSAGVTYSGIQIRANYMNDDGKSLQSRVLNVPGTLGAYQVKKIKAIKANKVPIECTQAVIAVATASIGP